MLFLVLFFVGDAEDDEDEAGTADEPVDRRAPAASRCRRCPTGGAVRGAARPLTLRHADAARPSREPTMHRTSAAGEEIRWQA